MNYMEGTTQIKAMLQQKGDEVISSLQHITKELIAMVECDILFSFEFNSNMNNGEKKPENIIVHLSPSKAHRKIQLGSTNNNLSLFTDTLSKETLDSISTMNDYLIFLNGYMTFAIPEIRRPTRFRKESNPNSDQPKLPKFAETVLASS